MRRNRGADSSLPAPWEDRQHLQEQASPELQTKHFLGDVCERHVDTAKPQKPGPCRQEIADNREEEVGWKTGERSHTWKTSLLPWSLPLS